MLEWVGPLGRATLTWRALKLGYTGKLGMGRWRQGVGVGVSGGSFWQWRDSECGMMHEGVRVDVGSRVSKAVPDQAFGLRPGLESLQ